MLGVRKAVQVLTGGINGAVDWTFSGATHAVLLCLVQVVGDTSFCTVVEFRLVQSSCPVRSLSAWVCHLNDSLCSSIL